MEQDSGTRLTGSNLIRKKHDWRGLILFGQMMRCFPVTWGTSHFPSITTSCPRVQPRIGIIWSIFQNYHQLPEVPLVQAKIGIIWSFPQNYHQLSKYPNIRLRLYIDHFPKITISCPRYPWCSQKLKSSREQPPI